MIITRATDYSIRAVLRMAEHHPTSVVSKHEICTAEGITPAFLAKILQPLIKSGIVRSKRGVSGGFALAKDPSKLTVLDIMKAVDEPLELNRCVLKNKPCVKNNMCPVHDLWLEAKDSFEAVFSKQTLAELAKVRSKKGASVNA